MKTIIVNMASIIVNYMDIFFFELNEVAALLGNSKRMVRVIVNEF